MRHGQGRQRSGETVVTLTSPNASPDQNTHPLKHIRNVFTDFVSCKGNSLRCEAAHTTSSEQQAMQATMQRASTVRSIFIGY